MLIMKLLISLNISHSFLYLNLHVCHIEMLKQTTFYKKLQYLRCFCDRGAFLSILLSFKILEFSVVCFFDPELPLFSLEFESAIWSTLLEVDLRNLLKICSSPTFVEISDCLILLLISLSFWQLDSTLFLFWPLIQR